MIDFRPEHFCNLIQRSPEFASHIKIKYPELVPDVVSFVLNPNCSCKKKLIKFSRRNNVQLNKDINRWLDSNQDLNINLEAVFKNESIQENVKRREMDLTPDQVEFLKKRKEIVEQKRQKKKQEEVAKAVPTPAPAAPVQSTEILPEHLDAKKDAEKMRQITAKQKPRPKPQDMRDMAGEVVELEPDPANYKELITHCKANHWRYKGLSVVETEKYDEEKDQTLVVWLVFFY